MIPTTKKINSALNRIILSEEKVAREMTSKQHAYYPPHDQHTRYTQQDGYVQSDYVQMSGQYQRKPMKLPPLTLH